MISKKFTIKTLLKRHNISSINNFFFSSNINTSKHNKTQNNKKKDISIKTPKTGSNNRYNIYNIYYSNKWASTTKNRLAKIIHNKNKFSLSKEEYHKNHNNNKSKKAIVHSYNSSFSFKIKPHYIKKNNNNTKKNKSYKSLKEMKGVNHKNYKSFVHTNNRLIINYKKDLEKNNDKMKIKKIITQNNNLEKSYIIKKIKYII